MVLRKGDKGEQVVSWQRLLLCCGMGAHLGDQPDDGGFGTLTAGATRIMQGQLGLAETGEADAPTQQLVALHVAKLCATFLG